VATSQAAWTPAKYSAASKRQNKMINDTAPRAAITPISEQNTSPWAPSFDEAQPSGSFGWSQVNELQGWYS
jgi:hypothetical protein